MFNPICNNYHIHFSINGKKWCELNEDKSFTILNRKKIPWENN